MKILPTTILFLLISTSSMTQPPLQQIWVCMGTCIDQGGITHDGSLLDFISDTSMIAGSAYAQYFNKYSYRVDGKHIIIGLNDTLGKIEYLSKDLLALKFPNQGIGLYKPLKYQPDDCSAFESLLLDHHWRYYKNSIENKILFYDIGEENIAPRTCYKKIYDDLNQYFSPEGWTMTNYKGHLLLSISFSPSRLEIFEISSIKDDSFKASVFFKSYEDFFSNIYEETSMETAFYSLMDTVLIQVQQAIPEDNREKIIKLLENADFKIKDCSNKGGGRKEWVKMDSYEFFSEKSVKNKELKIKFTNDSIHISEGTHKEFSSIYELSPDGSYIVVDKFSDHGKFIELYYDDEKVRLRALLKTDLDDSRFKYCSVNFE